MRILHGRSRALHNALLGTIATVAGGLFATAADALDVARAGDTTRCCRVVELRQYALHPQRFDKFTTLFEREFIEPQEAAGITVIGQFRNLDNPDRFVWLRGFRDMASRAAGLEAFYGGALWKSLRDEANASFTDTDNVLLLRPSGADAQFDLGGKQRAASVHRPARRISSLPTIWTLDAAAAPASSALVRCQRTPVARAGRGFGDRILRDRSDAEQFSAPAGPRRRAGLRVDRPVCRPRAGGSVARSGDGIGGLAQGGHAGAGETRAGPAAGAATRADRALVAAVIHERWVATMVLIVAVCGR